MGAPSCEDAHFLALKFRRGNLSLLHVIVVHPYVENKDQPDVAIVLQAVKAATVDLVDECEAGSCILHEA